jgi:tetratricopeptide (TPR) repeat protein
LPKIYFAKKFVGKITKCHSPGGWSYLRLFLGRTAYNRSDVSTLFATRLRRAALAFAGLALMLPFVPVLPAQTANSSATEEGRGRILLVLPFDNRSGQPSLEWVREAASDLLARRFASAGFAPMSRVERRYAFDHLGLPENFQPTRASSLKLAQTLDADSIVVGSFLVDGSQLVAEARLVDVPHLRMSEAITVRGPLNSMIDVFDSLAWKLTRQLDPSYSVAEETFIAAGKGIRVDAYEQYIRGTIEPDMAERSQHLQKAVALSPNLSSAWMALGREQYNSQQYEQAAASFAKVSRGDRDALEAGFYRGLSQLFSGDYSGAEKSFAAVARTLPLAEVENNQGVALSRQGRDGTDLFLKAEASDPTAPDYHFNLAVSLKRHGQTAGALNELNEYLKLRPADSEALSLQSAWKSSSSLGVAVEPLERIVRGFDATAFRQAEQMMEQVDGQKLAVLNPKERAGKLAVEGEGYLDRGLLLEGERQFLAAVAEDNDCAEAHVGLARIRERSGDWEAARGEIGTALHLKPTAEAYVILGRIDLATNHVEDARNDLNEALKRDAGSPLAKELMKQLEAKGSQGK